MKPRAPHSGHSSQPFLDTNGRNAQGLPNGARSCRNERFDVGIYEPPSSQKRKYLSFLGACRENGCKDFAEKILAHICPLTSFSIASNGFGYPVFCDS